MVETREAALSVDWPHEADIAGCAVNLGYTEGRDPLGYRWPVKCARRDNNMKLRALELAATLAGRGAARGHSVELCWQ